MTKRHSATVLSTELDLLAKQPLDQADDAVLVRAARAFWYSADNLETALNSFLRKQQRKDVEVRRVGYFLERLTQFTCATDARVFEANRALDLVASRKQGNVVAKGRVDRLALSWGLDKGLGLKVQALMPYQTRHFEATQRQMQVV
ncbi:hypothetical protein D3C77_344970 [compost metagenome]